MGDFDKTNRGAVFKNDRKEGENDPDFKGTLNVDGVDHWVNGWRKVSKSGVKFLSLSIKRKTETNSKPKAKPDVDDEIVF
jgi:uncharacterized protein (DUF736 family)